MVFRNLNHTEHSACNGKLRLLVFRKFVPKRGANEMGATWGYARVSTEDQELGLQISALRAAGVPEANIVQGKAGSDRLLYASLLARLTAGDRLVVWKVARLGRSTLESLNSAKDWTTVACTSSSPPWVSI
jgi:hypothetical protein